MPTKAGTKYKSLPAIPDHQNSIPKIRKFNPILFLFQKISYSLSGLQTVAYQDKTVSDFS